MRLFRFEKLSNNATAKCDALFGIMVRPNHDGKRITLYVRDPSKHQGTHIEFTTGEWVLGEWSKYARVTFEYKRRKVGHGWSAERSIGYAL